MKPNVLVFGAGGVFDFFLNSGDIEGYNVLAVLDNQKAGSEYHNYPVVKPKQLHDFNFDLIILALWDKPGVIKEVCEQLTQLGANPTKIKVYSYDRHLVCDVEDTLPSRNYITNENMLYAWYDLNSNSETYDITSFLVTADCYREERGLSFLHLVIVARDEKWQAQAYCLEGEERRWRAENILKQSALLLPACVGVTVCSFREQALWYLNQAKHSFPEGYQLQEPPPIMVHRDFYYWHDKGIDPRRLKAPKKAIYYVNQYVQHQLPTQQQQYLCVTLRESTLQPRRNSDLEQWQQFFEWLSEHHPWLAIVVIRDTENIFLARPFDGANIFYFENAAFHMSLRMALYEQAYLNMGCSNGPMQLCHLSKSASSITTKMIVNDYFGSSAAKFTERKIEIGKNFRFSDDNQIINWGNDDSENLINAFSNFYTKFPPENV